MIKVTSEMVLRNIRLALIALGGIFVSKGITDAGMMETILGGVMIVVTWAWSLFANRLFAKINEVAGNPGFIVLAPTEVADAHATASVMSIDKATVVTTPVEAAAVKSEDPTAGIAVKSTSESSVVPR